MECNQVSNIIEGYRRHLTEAIQIDDRIKFHNIIESKDMDTRLSAEDKRDVDQIAYDLITDAERIKLTSF